MCSVDLTLHKPKGTWGFVVVELEQSVMPDLLYGEYEMAAEWKQSGRLYGNHRRYKRQSLNNYTGDISDERVVVNGIVENVSASGFKLTGVSNAFASVGLDCSVVVSGDGKNFKLKARPCWEKQGGASKEIGFKVVDASWEWYEFVLEALHDEPHALQAM